jgi:hypothetical protein
LFTFETARSETPDNLWEITFRLTNVIPERIIFVSRGITVVMNAYLLIRLVTRLAATCRFHVTCGAGFWPVTPSSLVKCTDVVCEHAVFIFSVECGNRWFLRNVGTCLPNRTASRSRTLLYELEDLKFDIA